MKIKLDIYYILLWSQQYTTKVIKERQFLRGKLLNISNSQLNYVATQLAHRRHSKNGSILNK